MLLAFPDKQQLNERLRRWLVLETTFRLSQKFKDWPKIVFDCTEFVWLYRRFPDYLEHSSRPFGNCSYCPENHQTFWKSSRNSGSLTTGLSISFWKPFILSGNLPDCLEVLKNVQKSCRLFGNFLDCPEIFQEIFHTFQKFSRLSRSLQDCPEIFKTVWKSSPYWLNDQKKIYIALSW